jgi:hypothetical protein
MIMVIEQEGGMRSILLGDSSEEINVRLKGAFTTLMRAAWRMKKARDVVLKDIRFITNGAGIVLFDDADWKKYNVEKLPHLLEVQATKITYKYGKAE